MREKYANTMNYGDKLYFPEVDKIREAEITKITKTAKGIVFETTAYDFDNSLETPAISTTVIPKSHNLRTWYCRVEDAEKEQYKLRVAELKRLQSTVNNAINTLHLFTNKYFVVTEEPQKP